MDWLGIILGGVGGSVVSSVAAYGIYLKSQKPPSGAAYQILKKIGKRLREPEGEYYFSKSVDANYEIAKEIYGSADGYIISTAFSENPAVYGMGDLARGFKYGSLLRRITAEDVCTPKSQAKASENLEKSCRGACLIVIPKASSYNRIDGMFCKFHDDTYLTFVAFRVPEDGSSSRGVIFRDGIAEQFYEYYDALANKHTE